MEGVFALILWRNNIFNSKRIFKGVMALAVALLILITLTAPVFAQDNSQGINVNLRINASWGGGDILNLDIFDLDTGERQQVAIRLSEFINEGENVPYILLQAMDLMGERQSGVIQIENPLFDPSRVTTGATVGDSGSSIGVDELPDNLQNIVAEANQPDPTPPPTLTPDGTGTVVDNIMTVNNIEFFTVTTDNGSDFFLVVDRQRTNNNVYLLNTVTEADLMALAEARGETLTPNSPNVSVTQPPVVPETPNAPTLEEILQAIQDANEQNQEEQQPSTPPAQNSSSGILFLLAIVLFLGGGAFAVWKWVLPMLSKSRQSSHDEEIEDELDEDGNDDDYSEDDVVEVANDEDEDFTPYGGSDDEDFPMEDFEERGGDEDDA